MTSTNRKFQLAAKELFNQSRGLNERVAKIVQDGQISSMFSAGVFTEAAAHEFAVNILTFTEDFIDNELEDIPEDELVSLLQERLVDLNEQLLSKISIKMSQSDIQDINGLKIVLKMLNKSLPKQY